MAGFRMLDHNYAFDTSATLSASSSNVDHPVSNLRRFFRSQVWRSSGHYVITASNRKIDFKEASLGSELTATLPIGNYTASELATHIKEQMESVGSETYTVSRSAATGKWTLSSGGAYLALLRNSGTNVANSVWSAIGFGTEADSTGALTYTGAKVAIHTEESILIDLRNSEQIDSFALMFNTAAGVPVKFSDSAVIKLQASAANIWAAPAVDVTLSIDANYDLITHFFSSAQTYRYWRVKIVDPQNAWLYVEVPKIILAKATTLGQVPEIGFKGSSQDMSQVSETEFGQRYADLYPTRKTFQFNYAAMDAADIETLELTFQRVGQVVPIALCLDPEGALFDKDRYFIYGYLSETFEQGQRFYSYFDTSLKIVEAL